MVDPLEAFLSLWGCDMTRVSFKGMVLTKRACLALQYMKAVLTYRKNR
jgi:hypothetical protein